MKKEFTEYKAAVAAKRAIARDYDKAQAKLKQAQDEAQKLYEALLLANRRVDAVSRELEKAV